MVWNDSFYLLFLWTVMAGCSSSVKLLCDSGSAVNASDFVRIVPSLFYNVLMFTDLSSSLKSVCSSQCLQNIDVVPSALALFFCCFQMREWGTVCALLYVRVCRLTEFLVFVCCLGWQDSSGVSHSDVPSTHLPAVAGERSWYHHPGQTK